MRTSVALACVLAAVAAVAQTEVRQGEPDLATRRFMSPLVLETPFPLADPESWNGRRVHVKEVSGAICEGVSFASLTVAGKAKRGRSLKVTYYFVLTIEPGVDKFATVVFQTVHEGKVTSEVSLKNIDAEEGKIAIRDVSVLVPSNDLSAAKLVTTLYVRDNR